MASLSRFPLEIPVPLRNVLRLDPEAMQASPMFTSAVAYASAGIPVVPCTEDSRAPHTVGAFRHGARSATADPERVRDHWYEHPYDNVAIAPDGSFVLADIDPRNGGSLEAAEAIGLPIDGYRERTVSGGYRIPLILPNGIMATHSREPVPGVELKASGAYALAPHSRIDGRWYRAEPRREVWRLGAIPEGWEFLDRLTGRLPGSTAAIRIVPSMLDWREASRLDRHIRAHATYRDAFETLHTRSWQDAIPAENDGSESGRDFQLLFIATHFLREDSRAKEILYALLWDTGWPTDPDRSHPKSDPEYYCSHSVINALLARLNKDHARLIDQYERFFLPTFTYLAYPPLPPPPIPNATTVTDGALRPYTSSIARSGRSFPAKLLEVVLTQFLAAEEHDEFSRGGRWRRVPVQDFADVAGVDRGKINDALNRMKMRGLVERQFVKDMHDGKWRQDSLARLVILR